MPPFGIKETGVESRFITEKEQSLGVGIQTADWIDTFWKSKISQRPVRRPISCELSESRGAVDCCPRSREWHLAGFAHAKAIPAIPMARY